MTKKKRMVLVCCTLILGLFGILVGTTGADVVNATEVIETEQEIPEGYTPIYDIGGLDEIRGNPSGNYILMNDIDMTELTKAGGDNDCGTGWNSIESFSGILDGNGHRIIGMQIFGEFTTANIGLFEETRGATIIDLGMVDCKINVVVNDSNYETYIGIISGGSFNSSFTNCYTSGKINVQSDKYFCYVGGCIGAVNGDSIKNCYNNCDIDTVNSEKIGSIGGIIGDTRSTLVYSHYESKLITSYNVGKITGISEDASGVGALSGYGYNLVVTDCNYLRGTANRGIGHNADTTETVALSEAQMKNSKYFTGYDFETVWEIDPHNEKYSYPQLKNNRMIKVESVVLKKAPTKIVYFQGDDLELGDSEVEISYETGLVTSIPLTENMLGEYDMTAIGTQEIVVNYGGVETSFEIEVKEIPVESITIPETLSIYRSRTQQLTAEILPKNATDKTVTWESSDDSIVSVDANGLIRAKAKGTATITATTANGLSAECEVTVNVASVSVTLSETSVTMKEGDSKEITAQISPLESTDTIQWESSNEEVAEILDGTIIAKSAGVATISAYTESGVFAECTVTIEQVIPVLSITIPETVSIYRSKTQQLTAEVLPKNATDKTVTWETSNDSIVSVDANGLIRAKAKGTATITATTANGLSAECEVTVNVASVSVTLSMTSVTMKAGESKAITAQILPLDSTDTIQWKTSNEAVAEILDGTIMAKSAGVATISAYTESGVFAECTVTIEKPAQKPSETTPGTSGETTDVNSKNPTVNQPSTQNDNKAQINKVKKIKAKIKSIKNVKSKKINLKLSGLSNCDGYQIQYATKKNFKSSKKLTKGSSSVTINKLKKGKKYYVRVRVYKKIAGTTYYGKWSSVKSVKIKK